MEKQAHKGFFTRLKDLFEEEGMMISPRQAMMDIIGGEVIYHQIVRRQIWLILLILGVIVGYTAVRYQCQQDIIKISKLENELLDAKYRELASSSELTEKTRQSKVQEQLRLKNDTTLKIASYPPFIIYIEK